MVMVVHVPFLLSNLFVYVCVCAFVCVRVQSILMLMLRRNGKKTHELLGIKKERKKFYRFVSFISIICFVDSQPV